MSFVTTNIDYAANELCAGKLVAFPTETVYGLGADARNKDAIARVFAAKDRPLTNPLIVHVADKNMAFELGEFNDTAREFARSFWPGPLSLVVPRKSNCMLDDSVCANQPYVALRVPGHGVARRFLATCGIPVVAPSANPSGALSPTNSQHVLDCLATRIDMVLEGGACDVGLESTLISCVDEEPVLLRAGGIALEDIDHVLGISLSRVSALQQNSLRAPGQDLHHYAPIARLRINATHVEPDEALVAFGRHVPDHTGICRNLSPDGDLEEAATNLFGILHELDNLGCKQVAIVPIEQEGLGLAINDRLRRASRPKG